jgi:diacylglycerol kinase (ATP)
MAGYAFASASSFEYDTPTAATCVKGVRNHMFEQSLARSFGSAFRGIKHVLHERNFVIQATAGILAFVFAEVLNLGRSDKIVIVILVGFVLASEAMNSACERMLDFITKEHNDTVACIKEILAGAVLVYSFSAVIVGIWIFSSAIFR